ncbi:MAG: hypothetical protein GC164_13840 [Phycisphaera sp.]|nr:hypothetical protein [Phycisphaera sp.]
MKQSFASCILIILTGIRMAGPTWGAELFRVGTGEKYQTISSALLEMQPGDTCIIQPGVYRERIQITQDNITLRGEGRVVVTGCDEAGEGTPVKVNGADALEFSVQGPVYDAFCGNTYMMPARYPNKTSSMTSNLDWAETVIGPDGNIAFTGPAGEDLPRVCDGYYVGLHGRAPSSNGTLSSWYSISAPIIGVTDSGLVRVDQDKASSGFLGMFGQGHGLGYIIGAKAVCDAPGEWYSDGHKVVLIPPKQGDGEYELRTRLYGLVVTGNGVRVENLRFKAAAARIEGNNAYLGGCLFEYISPFQHTPNEDPRYKRGQSMICGWGTPDNGTAGVFVTGDGFVAENCRFARSWWCGMMLRGNKARIENCLYEDVNWIAKRCAGLFAWGDDNVVRYCTFRNLGGGGIEGGNAGWVEQYARQNVWEYNYIEDICKLIVDQGFFYVNHQSGDNPKANSIWRYNVGKDGNGPEKGKWANSVGGYYVDNNSSGYRIHNNIAIDVKQALKYNDFRDGAQAGKDVWLYNNTLYKCPAIGIGCNGEPDAQVHLINNISLPQGRLRFSARGRQDLWLNNADSLTDEALKDPAKMDFTPVDEKLKTGGIPVLGQEIPYMGAVDPAKGMWRYGADESKLPELDR